MPCRDEKIDGKIIQGRRYQEHNSIALIWCYTRIWFVLCNNGHKVKMKMTPIKVSYICSDPSHMKRETERRQHVSDVWNDMKMVI